MNLVITKACNRKCPYCFAKSEVELGQSVAQQNISIENVKRFLSFLKKSHMGGLKLLGGEPTLHPKYTEIVDLGIKDDIHVTTFTNGLWPQKVIDYYKASKYERFSFVFNVNEQKLRSKDEYKRLSKSLKAVAPKSALGFNIFEEDFDLTFLCDIIDEFKLQPRVRIGMASPIVGCDNHSISTKALPNFAKRLVEQLRYLDSRNVIAVFDCGFTFCMFDEEDVKDIVYSTAHGLFSKCTFIGDVDYKLNVWPCFPLSNIPHVNLNDFKNYHELHNFYDEKLRGIRRIGSKDECLTCRFMKRNQCCGGCMARTMNDIIENNDPAMLEKMQMQLSQA